MDNNFPNVFQFFTELKKIIDEGIVVPVQSIIKKILQLLKVMNEYEKLLLIDLINANSINKLTALHAQYGLIIPTDTFLLLISVMFTITGTIEIKKTNAMNTAYKLIIKTAKFRTPFEVQLKLYNENVKKKNEIGNTMVTTFRENKIIQQQIVKILKDIEKTNTIDVSLYKIPKLPSKMFEGKNLYDFTKFLEIIEANVLLQLEFANSSITNRKNDIANII